MVTIGMNYRVLPGKSEVFEKACDRVIQAMKAMPGHTQSQVYRNVHEERSYLILSEWDDKASFDEFVRSEAFAKVTQWGKEQVLADRPKHQVFQLS